MKLRISKLKLVLLMAMSVFGLWASSMVVFVFWLYNQPLPLCPVGVLFHLGNYVVFLDCGTVLHSQYSNFFGVPLELFAVAYFIINLLLVFFVAFGSEKLYRRSLRALFGWRFLGLIIVPYLVFVEFVLLRAVCVYCTVMHVAIVLDFIIISYFLFYKKNSLLTAPVPAATPPAP